MNKIIFLTILCFPFLFTGTTDSAFPETVLQEGKKLYQRTCSVCHADNGNGETFVATALSTQPRNFLDPEYREHLTRDEMYEHLTHGCDKTAMQPFQYQLYEEERYAVIDYIRIKLMKVVTQKEVTTHSEHGEEAHAEHACPPYNLPGLKKKKPLGKRP